jgi:hypothetical protein
MSLEKSIQKLTNAITAAKMDPSLMGGPVGPRPPKKPTTYGPVKIVDSNNQVKDCECVEQIVGNTSTFCVTARCPDGSFCRMWDDGWRCQAPIRFPEIVT